MSAISSDEIISILKEEIKNYDVISRDQEVGTVISVGDGIASVYGIDHAMYGEIVTLETGLKGMVQDIKENEISCILFGDDSEIKQGTKVCRTGKKAGIPVGEGYIGRIVDALGAPIDGKGEIKADGYRPVENEAPGIVERKSVSVPLETGILSIDSMFPIGRGQRELIIGDRQTGKTSIATDTIINQKGKDVICIYVAIGQKASTVARLVNDLKAHDALDYTTVFCSTASECAPLQYIVPYSATALAEYFMYQGKDVLIVYDDLSKHAVAPGIVERKSVSVPLETGILSIDSMFPIGRGQRELIIGDRQTGKTSIATDTIINQKGKDVICIYVAIGQKASTVARLVNDLKAHDALDYTTVFCSTASECAPLQYIVPYSATALAEYFMYQGKDVLIVYDDLSKHAVAYRAISLLLGRSPGREAYPGDVFYLHSRLLERSSRLSEEAGGGSITALPIIETQAGDVSAYIPTNVISITDGQIFLESDLFNAGMRPAVNVGLSVSRVGGAAQTKAMKKASGSVRIDLAQAREMESFTQFSSDLDDATKNQLKYGSCLTELLKQPLGRPLSLHEQVITLCVATNKMMLDIDTKKIKEFQMDMLAFFDREHKEIGKAIDEKKVLDDELKEQILAAAKEFKERR